MQCKIHPVCYKHSSWKNNAYPSASSGVCVCMCVCLPACFKGVLCPKISLSPDKSPPKHLYVLNGWACPQHTVSRVSRIFYRINSVKSRLIWISWSPAATEGDGGETVFHFQVKITAIGIIRKVWEYCINAFILVLQLHYCVHCGNGDFIHSSVSTSDCTHCTGPWIHSIGT